MQNGAWFWATTGLLAAYGAVILYFVWRGAVRTRSLSDYAIGSQGFSPVVVGLSLAASVTSAATFIINPGFVAMYGWSAFLAMSVALPLGLVISLIVLTRQFRRYGTLVKALTLAQWVGSRYESAAFARWMAVLSMLLLTFIVLICVGLTKVIAQALGAAEWGVLLGLVVFVFGYMMFGGANSLVYTNTVQALLMLLVAIVMLGSGWEHMRGGMDGFWAKLAAIDPVLTAPVNPHSPLFRDWFEVAFCNFVVGVAIVCQPHIVTRSLMLRDEGDVNRYLLVAIAAETVFFAVLWVGFYARLQFPELSREGIPLKMDGIVPLYVVSVFSVGAGLLVVMGLLSAGLSTLESLIQSLSTTLTADLIALLRGRSFLEGGAEGVRRTNALHKAVIVLVGMAAAAWSYDQLLHPNLSVGILAQNGVYAFFSSAFVPVLFGIFFKKPPKMAAFSASVTAVLVHFAVYYGALTPYTQGVVRNPAVAATCAILASLAVGLAIYFFYEKKRLALPLLLAGSAAFAQGTMDNIPYPVETRTVELPSGIRIAYTDTDSGATAILMVHGLGSNLKCWQKNTAELRGRYRCIALDLPGYGRSSGGGHYPYDMAFYAEVLIEFKAALGLKDLVLMGHSMGGQISVHVLLRDPGFARALVLLAPAGFETFNEQEQAWFSMVYTPALLKATPPAQIRKNFELNFTRFPDDAEFMVQDRMALRETPAYDAYCEMIPRCVAGMLNQPVFERLHELQLPVLVAFGEDDKLIPNRILHKDLSTEQVAKAGQGWLPNSQLLLLPACGHFVQWECASLLNRAILDFLS